MVLSLYGIFYRVFGNHRTKTTVSPSLTPLVDFGERFLFLLFLYHGKGVDAEICIVIRCIGVMLLCLCNIFAIFPAMVCRRFSTSLTPLFLLVLVLLVLSHEKVLIWRAYRLHGAALKDMKRNLKAWESFLSNKRAHTAGLGMA